MLTVVKGSPTPEELAALVLVVAAASSGGDDAAAPAPELSRWASRAGNLGVRPQGARGRRTSAAWRAATR
ncbi:acyl-CoA carboxylase epsilon subunit [Arsenicicoccus piscis]|uniref:Acyl-CoA carboxylase subunit epsilon n=1 Tax=Arsenicicoccus piscis TaxID=673954 RepID=A0ABQ6HRR1_9MICO|nr:hypothetical protein GCM10025862_23840 [Arsenicicoccus piscis]